jgi:UDP-N-acetylmuramoyl-tripeptide--D-alanyl-D-alanine ligase
MGAHQANNLAAVASALLPQGFSWQQIQAGLTQLVLPSGRLRVLQPVSGLIVIDDSYNANPASMVAGIKVLMEQPAELHLFVMGAMGELGADSEMLHLAVVDAAKQAGVSQLFASGIYKQRCVEQFGLGVANDSPQVLAQRIWQVYQLQPSLAVLIKGSRSSKMERVVVALQQIIDNENNKYIEG